jgi:hypothetical protein
MRSPKKKRMKTVLPLVSVPSRRTWSLYLVLQCCSCYRWKLLHKEGMRLIRVTWNTQRTSWWDWAFGSWIKTDSLRRWRATEVKIGSESMIKRDLSKERNERGVHLDFSGELFEWCYSKLRQKKRSDVKSIERKKTKDWKERSAWLTQKQDWEEDAHRKKGRCNREMSYFLVLPVLVCKHTFDRLNGTTHVIIL